MVRVVFIGFGNVNQQLCNALQHSATVNVVQIYNRSAIAPVVNAVPIPRTQDFSEIMEADVYIIGVPDDAISGVSAQLPFKDRLTVHTSGSVSLQEISNTDRRGVFYPLQTFSKDRTVDFSEIPICIEAETPTDLRLLRELSEAISPKVTEISSEERRIVHLAAVFVNNFGNYLYQVSHALLQEKNLDFELLRPLIRETAEKAISLSPYAAQTGPARRNDRKTIEKHLHLLPEGTTRELYILVTEAIQNTYGKKL
ncbi:MAG: hypothetical protein CMC08_05715 [Flavobacteriaceae bacterium]|nr:hypothetical protein [Flavobacteriaceae bacterium]